MPPPVGTAVVADPPATVGGVQQERDRDHPQAQLQPGRHLTPQPQGERLDTGVHPDHPPRHIGRRDECQSREQNAVEHRRDDERQQPPGDEVVPRQGVGREQSVGRGEQQKQRNIDDIWSIDRNSQADS